MLVRSFPRLIIGLSFFACLSLGQCYGQPSQEVNSANPNESAAVPFLLQISGEQYGTSVAEILQLPVEAASEPGVPSSTSEQGQYYVILFDGSQMKHLPSRTEFRDDLKALKETVIAAGVPEKNIIECSGENTGTRVGFGRIVTNVAERAKRNDFILIAMQGYATHLDDVDYILPYDTNPNDIRDSVRAPEKLSEKYRESLIPVQGVLNLLSQNKKTNDSDKCKKMIVLINPFSVAPADVAKLTVQETFPTIPFGHQEWVLPTGTIVVTSRALRLMPENHALFDTPKKAPLRTTVFMRIVLEGLSGLARQTDSDSKLPIVIGEFLTFLNNRSEIQGFAKPNIRFHADFQFRMLPYFDAPPMVQELRKDVVAQVQTNHYQTGLFLLFGQQDPQSSSLAFANCEGMTQNESLSKLARQMRFCSYLSFGDIPRLIDENSEKRNFPGYIVQQTSVFDAPDGQPLQPPTPTPPPQSQPVQTNTRGGARRPTQYSNVPSSAKTNAAKPLVLLAGDRVEILEVVQKQVENDMENADSTENETVDKVTDDADSFDQKDWELHHRTENAWIRIGKVERLVKKPQVSYDQYRRQTRTTEDVFEEVLSGQESIQGWVPAEAFNFVAFKYRQDKTLFDALEMTRAEINVRELKKTRQEMAPSASAGAQPRSQQTQTQQPVQQQPVQQQPLQRAGRILDYVPGLPF